MASEKEYTTTVDLSRSSNSDDLGGEVTEVPVAAPPDRAAVERALDAFRGEIMQLPPQFSAMKVGGQRAYALAREGTHAPLQPRPVQIFSLELLKYEYPSVDLHIRCGKGTYIRSLARDLGIALNTGGLLTALRRTRVGAYDIAMAKTLDQLPQVLLQHDLLPSSAV